MRGGLDRLMLQDEERLHILALEPRCNGRAHSVQQRFFSIV